MVWTSHPVKTLAGRVKAPGDKSCSHRALIFGGLAAGTTRVTGLLEGDDVLRTADAVRALGADVTQTGPGAWTIIGVGKKGFTSPDAPLDFGNSGTGSRLLMGAMAGFDLEVEITGDASLSARPMGRILNPLREMGARTEPVDAERLPFKLIGTSALEGTTYTPPKASAQIKSAVMLAALSVDSQSYIHEPKPTRDHTEKMLKAFQGAVAVQPRRGGGQVVTVRGGFPLTGIDFAVPGDPSSVAFLIAAALISPRGAVEVTDVMSNPTRDGFYAAASMMAAGIGAEATGESAGERIVDLSAQSSAMKGADIPERLVPSMIDEFPILAVLAAFAKGATRVTGAEELRVKETDRITATVDMLRVNGVEVEETPDGFIVQGCDGPPPGGGLVETRHDHRIAMSALIMGTAAKAPVSVDDVSMIDTSYPEFLEHMAELGADIRERGY